MDPVQMQTFGIIDRVAAMTIPHGRAVARDVTAGQIALFGQSGLVIDDCQSAAWAAEANVTCTLGTDGPDGINYARMAVADGHTTGLAATSSFAAKDLSGYGYINFLCRSSVALAAADYDLAVSETTAGGGTLEEQDIPAMVAGRWYYFSVAFNCTTAERDAVLSLALEVTVDKGALNFDIAYVYASDQFYGIDGVTVDDKVQASDQTLVNQGIAVVNSGIVRVPLASGETIVANQPVYPVPGTGKFTGTLIEMDGRQLYAVYDQATAGGNVGVLI